MIERTDSGAVVITGYSIQLAQRMAQRGAVRLEMLGLRRSGGLLWKAIAKKEGITGRGKIGQARVYDWLCDEIERLKEVER